MSISEEDSLTNRGLCFVFIVLNGRRELSVNEYLKLRIYLESNQPFLSKIGLISDGGYYWKKGDIKPRIKWLDKHIKKNS